MTVTAPEDGGESGTSRFPRFQPKAIESGLRLMPPAVIGNITSLHHIDPKLAGDALKLRASKFMIPVHLFSTERLIYSSMHNKIRDFLNKSNADINVYSSKLIISQYMYGLCEEAKDRKAALELAKDLLSRYKKICTSFVKNYLYDNYPQCFGGWPKKNPNNVTMRLKEGANKI